MSSQIGLASHNARIFILQTQLDKSRHGGRSCLKKRICDDAPKSADNVMLFNGNHSLGVFCSAVAYALWAFAFSKLGASKANVYSNLIPVFTAIFSYFIIHESLTANKIIGILVVVVGLVLSQLKAKKQ